MSNNTLNYGARETALIILYSVEEQAAYSNLILDQQLTKTRMDIQDKRLVTELVYGVLRWKLKLDWIINSYLKSPLAKLPLWIKLILRLGVYQLVQTGVPPSAAVNESVKLAKKYGHVGTVRLVNGVLRAISRNLETIDYPELVLEPVEHISVLYSHPDWMVERWIKRYGIESTIALCNANNSSPGMSLRVNSLRISREELLNMLKAEGVEAETSQYIPDGVKIKKGFSPRNSKLFEEGLVIPQDEAAIMVGHLLAPKPGDLVMDCCAAPGGKTTHLAQLMKNKGKIYAFDVHPHRLRLIEEACRNTGMEIVRVGENDARDLEKIYSKKFDCVLVDSPCSGTGVLRRKPDARWRKNIKQIQQFSKLQLEILESAAKTVKIGGSIVYSTCSLEPEEGEKVIQKFLASNSDFTIVNPLFSLSWLEGLSIFTEQGYVRTYPHLHGTDGFFMAKLQRKE